MTGRAALWPDLAYPVWRDTAATLQLWTQIVGKLRLRLTPWLNHGWQVPLYVTARGLGTAPIPVAARDHGRPRSESAPVALQDRDGGDCRQGQQARDDQPLQSGERSHGSRAHGQAASARGAGAVSMAWR